MLSSNRRPRRRHPPVERPTPHWFTLGSLRSFGTRLRNPPPPSNEEHYVWLVKPKYTVRLEDVVADKHLPPLSRHDFEEYLYYVEGSLRNLYFHEWVHHYRQLFEHWAESVLGANVPSSSKGGYRPRELWERLKNCQDPRLRKEFALAKDTFFRPGASMRLNIPSEYLDCILLIPNAPPPYDELELTDKMPSFPSQPEPGIFDSILKLVRDALNTSFATFIKLAFSNAGLWHCVPGACGGALIVAGGLAMWSIGMTSHRRGYVVGSLPIIWIGMWFMLVTLSGHCLTVYVTGDARQLYPWETERPLPPEVVPPSVYSLTPAPAPEGVMSTPTPYQQYLHYSSPLTCRSLSIHQHTHLARTLVERRWSEGILKMLGRDKGDDGSTVLARKTEREPSNQLPPARKTKGLARNSLTMDAEQVNTLEQSGPASVLTTSPKDSATDLSQRRNAVVDISMELAAMGSGAEGRPDSPLSEENDFGIVLSEAFEEDEIPEMHHFSTPSQPYSTPTLTHDKGLATRRPSCSTWVPNPSRQAPIAPLLQRPPSMLCNGDEQCPIFSRPSPLMHAVGATY
ncbi:RGS domain protein, putative [Rhizoctonia solani AG-3 Rhs1AP]|uniref:RGS domain protein, putative n=1 Tax=Rhizoctonia solani AG-3 Rhs1AP TaxID=1086054 RepID=A0A0A1UKD3_9AGAM|nr:RGS domain protein, putative [Rhizoctonia solani AG-3 Rhs1AP]